MMKIFFLLTVCVLLFSVTPFFPLDAMLVLVIVYSLNATEIKGLSFSFMTGVLHDIAVPHASLLAPCYAILGTLQSFTGRFIYRRNLLYIFLFVALATLLKAVYLLLVMNVPADLHEFQRIMPPLAKEIAANVAVTPFFYFILFKNPSSS